MALEHGDREVVSILKSALRNGYSLLVPPGVID